MHHFLIFVVTMLAFFLNLSAQDGEKNERTEKQKSKIDWKEVDAEDFAKKLERATSSGEKWTKNPESIILEYAGPFVSEGGEKVAASRNIRINTKGERLPKFLNVILIDEGLYDDSIKAQKRRLSLSRNKEGIWKLHKVFHSQVEWPKLK